MAEAGAGDDQEPDGRAADQPLPRHPAPPGAVDCHVEPAAPRALAPSGDGAADDDAGDRDDLPAGGDPVARAVAAYRRVQAALGLGRAVLAPASDHGFDTGPLLEALRRLDAAPAGSDAPPVGCARAVALVAPAVSGRELAALSDAGVVGACFPMRPGRATPDGDMLARSVLDWADLDRLAWRVWDHGWDVTLQMEGDWLHEVEARLRGWPGRVVIDHFGGFRPPAAPAGPGFRALTRLIDRDKVWVKLSAPWLVAADGPPHYRAAAALAAALIGWAPERMVWGSGWPGRGPAADPPGDAALLDLLAGWAGGEAVRRRILVENPEALYRFDPWPGPGGETRRAAGRVQSPGG